MTKCVFSREAVAIDGIGAAYITELSAGDALSIIMAPADDVAIVMKFLVRSFVDESGAPLFADVSAAQAGLTFRAYSRLVPIVRRLNGLDEDELGKA